MDTFDPYKYEVATDSNRAHLAGPSACPVYDEWLERAIEAKDAGWIQRFVAWRLAKHVECIEDLYKQVSGLRSDIESLQYAVERRDRD